MTPAAAALWVLLGHPYTLEILGVCHASGLEGGLNR